MFSMVSIRNSSITLLILIGSNFSWAVKPGQKAPPVMLKQDNGQTFNLRKHMKNLDKNSITAFAFFSVTCKPCLKELPALQKLQNKYPQFKVFIISVDSPREYPREKTHALLSKIKVSMPVLYDNFKRVGRAYGVIDKSGSAVLPALFVLNSSRKIVIAKTGYSEKTMEAVQRLLERG